MSMSVHAVWDDADPEAGYVFFGTPAQAEFYAQALANYKGEPVEICVFPLRTDMAPGDLAAALLNGIGFSHGADEQAQRTIHPMAISNQRPHLQMGLAGAEIALADAEAA